jgi:glycosyltransferase involved in cell wall biosynthesis
MKDSDMAHTVTILMPCYNTSTYLEQALQSILSQTYKNIIVLVLDDGSTDKSLQIAQQIAQVDNRVKVFSNGENLGIIKSRNKLLDLCETEYAAWMDSDDIAHPERIKKQLLYMLGNPEYVACTCNYIRKGLGEERPMVISPHKITREYLLFYNYILNPGSFFYVPTCVKQNVRFREWLSGASDYFFWVELAKFGKIGVVDEILMTYRLHAGQETVAQKQRQLNGCLEIVQYQLAEFNCAADKSDLARLLSYPARILGFHYNYFHLFNNAKVVNSILDKVPKDEFDILIVKSLLLSLFRSHARRNGVVGFVYFVRLFKFYGLKQCKLWGLSLFWEALKTDALSLWSFISGKLIK